MEHSKRQTGKKASKLRNLQNSRKNDETSEKESSMRTNIEMEITTKTHS